MSDGIELIGGASISCTDGLCGTLGRLMVDPASRRVTHLSIEPMGLVDNGRLAPIELVLEGDSGLGLHCTLAEFAALPPNAHSGLQPVPGLRPGSVIVTWVTIFDVPEGAIEVNGDMPISATDGYLGHPRGITVSGANGEISELLLEIGEPDSRRNVALPLSAITSIGAEGIQLGLTKEAVEALS